MGYHRFWEMQIREECAAIIEEQRYAEATGKEKIQTAYELTCQ